MKTIFLLLSLCFFTSIVISQPDDMIKWRFKTNSKVLSHPVTDENRVYFGSTDSLMYALDMESGKKVWSIRTNCQIRSKPLIHDSIIYFKSGNDVYAVNKGTGNLLWRGSVGNSETGSLDLWDYHSGSPVVYDQCVYFGFNSGELMGFNLLDGTISKRINSIDNSPIRSGLILHKSDLFFGDWNGKVYSYDMINKQINWIYSTYEKQEYPTFGQIISQISILDTLLYFGSRNPELQVININSGEKEWSYTEINGGWISGDPLIKDDTLFIGGSDNHEMFAFDAYTGKRLWTYEFLNNNFTPPVVYKSWLVFTTGDAYNVWGNKPGIGYLYGLSRKEGAIKNFQRFDGNIYSGLIIRNNFAFFGCSDGYFYCVDIEKFLTEPIDLKQKGYKAFNVSLTDPPQFSDSLDITIDVAYYTNLNIEIIDLEENKIAEILSKNVEPGRMTIGWDGKNAEKEFIENGYYFVIISSGDYYVKSLIQKL